MQKNHFDDVSGNWEGNRIGESMKSLVSGDGGEGFGLAAGRHGNLCERGLLCGKAAADVGGHHGAGNHQTTAGSHLEVRNTHTHTKVTHINTDHNMTDVT